jgi:hypothetical protein
MVVQRHCGVGPGQHARVNSPAGGHFPVRPAACKSAGNRPAGKLSLSGRNRFHFPASKDRAVHRGKTFVARCAVDHGVIRHGEPPDFPCRLQSSRPLRILWFTGCCNLLKRRRNVAFTGLVTVAAGKRSDSGQRTAVSGQRSGGEVWATAVDDVRFSSPSELLLLKPSAVGGQRSALGRGVWARFGLRR